MNPTIERFRVGKPFGVSSIIRSTSGALQQWVENGFTASVTRYSADRTADFTITKGSISYAEKMYFDNSGDYIGSDGAMIPSLLSSELRAYGFTGANPDSSLLEVFTPELTDDELNGVVDATAKVLAAAQRLRNAGGGVFRVVGTPIVTQSILLPSDTDISFVPGSRVLTRPGGSYTANGVFLINTTDGSTWDAAYPNIRGSARNVRIDNSANPSNVVGAMVVGAPTLIENLYAQHNHFAVKTTSTYLDLLRINGCMSAEPQGANYPITLTSLGDGLSIRSCHSFLSGGGTPKNIKLLACQGGEIQGSIGGDVLISQSRAVKMHSCHHETGQIQIDGSDVAIESSYFWIGALPSIKMLGSSGGNRRNVSLRDLTFLWRKTNTAVTPTLFDVQTAPWYSISVNNIARCYGTNNNAYDSEKFGVLLQKGDNTAFTAWNNYAYALSKRGDISFNEMIEGNIFVNPGSGTCNLITAITGSSEAAWQGTTGTYYYQAQLVYDAGRKLGQNTATAEVSFAATNGGNVPQFTIGNGFLARSQSAFYRLYRGTTTGSYNFYVDIPLSCARAFSDRGDYAASFPWVSRTAGAVDSMQDIDNLQVMNGTVQATLATVPPTVGTWAVGDRAYPRTPVAGGFIGTVATAAGSPGTHKTYGAISP